MPKLKITFQKTSDQAKIPEVAYEHDAGFDLFSAEETTLAPGERKTVATGLKMAIPTGYAGLIWDKSGVAKNGIKTTGGVIDSGYRGEVLVSLINLSQDNYEIKSGQKIAQMLIQKVEAVELLEGNVEYDSERGGGSFGSSGLF